MTKHPQAIFVQLTTGCNARCISCPHPFTYGAGGSHPAGNMSQETWDTLVSQVSRAGYRGEIGLYLHHEPLLVRGLAEKIREINSETRAYVVLSTNGALLTPALREALIEARPRRVHVNMSSAEPAQYEAIMRLPWAPTAANVSAFVAEAAGQIEIEINCPLLPDVDPALFADVLPGVKVNAEYWANSRGGLLDAVSASGQGSRFKLGRQCRQPSQNFNVLWDGAVIVCCMDWAHESKRDFPNINDADLFETYAGALMKAVRAEFRAGHYERYRMCGACADEMGFERVRDA